MRFYGLANAKELESAILATVAALGGGSKAVCLMLGTCAAESNLGKARDNYKKSGYGLFQFDQIAIKDVIARTRPDRKQFIDERFGIDIDDVVPSDLNYSPLLSALFCRLHYLLVPESIPDTIEGRAKYWKKYYNTEAGKGTPDHYLKQSEQLFNSDLYNAVSD
ncbi:conserved hypothetical protein [Vibrio chagasii]|nr:conserved hypothetical protein [Vibrio chagasii]